MTCGLSPNGVLSLCRDELRLDSGQQSTRSTGEFGGAIRLTGVVRDTLHRLFTATCWPSHELANQADLVSRIGLRLKVLSCPRRLTELSLSPFFPSCFKRIFS